MTNRRHACEGAIAMRFRLFLMLLGSLATALITHVAIDVLGDVLIAHDAYDDLTHGSRQTGAIAMGVVLVLALVVATQAAFREARDNEGALLSLLRHALPRSAWCHSLAVTAISLVLVATMEACDAAAAGRPPGDIVELFGGSLLLAVAVAGSVAAFVTSFIRVALLRITELHGVIVAIVAAFVRITLPGRSFSLYGRRNGSSSYVRISLLGRTSGERAPPRFSSLVFS